jgi:hypothetical protein
MSIFIFSFVVFCARSNFVVGNYLRYKYEDDSHSVLLIVNRDEELTLKFCYDLEIIWHGRRDNITIVRNDNGVNVTHACVQEDCGIRLRQPIPEDVLADVKVLKDGELVELYEQLADLRLQAWSESHVIFRVTRVGMLLKIELDPSTLTIGTLYPYKPIKLVCLSNNFSIETELYGRHSGKGIKIGGLMQFDCADKIRVTLSGISFTVPKNITNPTEFWVNKPPLCYSPSVTLTTVNVITTERHEDEAATTENVPVITTNREQHEDEAATTVNVPVITTNREQHEDEAATTENVPVITTNRDQYEDEATTKNVPVSTTNQERHDFNDKSTAVGEGDNGATTIFPITVHSPVGGTRNSELDQRPRLKTTEAYEVELLPRVLFIGLISSGFIVAIIISVVLVIRRRSEFYVND